MRIIKGEINCLLTALSERLHIYASKRSTFRLGKIPLCLLKSCVLSFKASQGKGFGYRSPSSLEDIEWDFHRAGVRLRHHRRV